MMQPSAPRCAGPNVTPRGARSRSVVGTAGTTNAGRRSTNVRGMSEPLHRCSFVAELWEHDGPGGWCFVSLPEDAADDIEEITRHRTNGFGSVRVEVTVGATTWRTSLFPDTKRATFVLPVKRPVRAVEDLEVGAPVAVDLQVLDEGAGSAGDPANRGGKAVRRRGATR